MAVFWFGWAKKLKNVFTKKEADRLYLPKSFEATINEVKRLTTLKTYQETNSSIKITTTTRIQLNDLDINRPIYVRFLKRLASGVSSSYYSYALYLPITGDYTILNDYVSLKLTQENNNIYINFRVIINAPDGYFTNLTIKYTPKTL